MAVAVFAVVVIFSLARLGFGEFLFVCLFVRLILFCCVCFFMVAVMMKTKTTQKERGQSEKTAKMNVTTT